MEPFFLRHYFCADDVDIAATLDVTPAADVTHRQLRRAVHAAAAGENFVTIL
jgi:hypothetical protein